MEAVFFENQQAFRNWLIENHLIEKELIVGFYKVGTGKPSMTWSESVDQALCFGWIDGVRNSINSESYCIRFTPRRKNSIWSKINIGKVKKLMQDGLMTEEGIKSYGYRTDKLTGTYSFETEEHELSAEFKKIIQSNTIAWQFFEKLPPSYKKAVSHWVMSAKQESTKLKRLEKLKEACAKQQRL